MTLAVDEAVASFLSLGSSLQLSGSTEPVHGIGQCLVIRPRSMPQFALGFGRRKVHAVLGHAQATDRRKWLPTGYLGGRLGCERQRKQQATRNPQSRRGSAKQAR